MVKSFMLFIKTEKELRDLQPNGLRWAMSHAYKGSKPYNKRLDEPISLCPGHGKRVQAKEQILESLAR